MKKLSVDVFAVFLALSAPLVGFLTFHKYSLTTPENLLFFGLLLAVALILGVLAKVGGKFIKAAIAAMLMTLLVDYQFSDTLQSDGAVFAIIYLALVFGALFLLSRVLHESLSQVLIAVFATIIVTTVFMPTPMEPSRITGALDTPVNKELPPVIHIVLDEHIGIEGIPASIKGGRDLKELLKEYYVSQGFTLFGKAFSNSYKTSRSLGSLVTLGEVLPEDNLTNKNEEKGTWGSSFAILENPFFDLMKKRGYHFNIYQIDYLDFCAGFSKFPGACITYPCCSVRQLAPLPLSAVQKFRVVAGAFLEPLVTYKITRKAYRFLGHVGLPIPYWEWERTYVSTVSGFDILNRLKSDVGQKGRGQFYFAHVLLPHSPYIYGRGCAVNPPEKWLSNFSEKAIDPDRWRGVNQYTKNMPETRAERYLLYFEQTQCTLKLLGGVFQSLKEAGLYDESIIIIHGDHGSRLPLMEPNSSRTEPLSTADMVDSFSSLFAVKAPGITPGYDLRRLSIPSLFADLVKGKPWTLSNDGLVEAESERPLIKDSAGPMRQMVDFGENADYQP